MYKSKDIEFHAADILLLMNLLQSSPSLRNSENWIPICLPGIAADGFIYAYIYFYEKNIGTIMITNEISNEMFHNCSQLGKNIQRVILFPILSNFNLFFLYKKKGFDRIQTV